MNDILTDAYRLLILVLRLHGCSMVGVQLHWQASGAGVESLKFSSANKNPVSPYPRQPFHERLQEPCPPPLAAKEKPAISKKAGKSGQNFEDYYDRLHMSQTQSARGPAGLIMQDI